MAVGDNYRRITPTDQLVFDSSGNLAGVRSGQSNASEGRMLTTAQAAAVAPVVLSSASSDAAVNVTTLQAALTAGGDVRVLTPGTYLFNSYVTIPSNTSLYLGPGVSLKVAPGAASALLTNAAARATGVSVPGANANYVSAPGDANNYAVAVTGLTAAEAARFPLNSWVSVVVLGHAATGAQGTAWAGRGYRGVYRVVENSGTGIKYLIDFLYPGSGPSTNALTLYPADENIKVWGPGVFDGNGENAASSNFDGDPRGNVIWWRHVYNLTVDGPHFRRGRTWTMGSNCLRKYRVRNVTCELRQGSGYSAVDMVHLSGGHRDVVIEDMTGGCGDNFVGMTIDCTEGTAYDFPYQHPGDMYDITVRNVTGDCVNATGGFAVVGMYGPAAYRYGAIKISGVRGAGSSGVQLSNYGTTNQNKLTVDDITIEDVRVATGGQQVIMSAGVFLINTMSVDGVVTIREDCRGFQIVDGATGTVRSLSLSNFGHSPYDAATFSRTVPLMEFGGITLTAAKISNVETIAMAANVKLLSRTGAGVITKLVIEDATATGSGTGAVWSNTGGGTAPTPVYVRSSYNGSAL